MSDRDPIELGMRVRDPITGFTGIAVGRATWLTGCDRVAIRGEVDENAANDRPDLYYVDEPALEIVDPDPSVKAHFESLGLTEQTDDGGPGRSIPK